MATHNIGRLSVSIGVSLASLKRGLSEAEGRFEKWSKKMGNAGRKMTRAITVPLGLAATAVVGMAAKFDKSMARSTAIMGNLSDAMKGTMARTAREMSKTTSQSAAELADSYYFLASAGLSATDSVASLGTVTRFATAGQFDMARATDLLTDAQSALGYSTKDLVKISDNLIRVTSLSNATTEQFSEALTGKAGPAMRAVGMEIEEGLAVLAAFATQGRKGTEASTQFAIVLRDLQTKAIKNAEAFRELGIRVYDDNQNFRNMADIIGDLEKALGGMADQERRSAMMHLGFSDKSVSATQALLGFSTAIRKYESILKRAAGTTERVSRKQLANMVDKFAMLKNKLVNVGITLGHTLMPLFEDLMGIVESIGEWTENLVTAFNKWDESSKKIIISLGLLVVALGPVMLLLRGLSVLITMMLIPAIKGLLIVLAFAIAHPLVALGVIIAGLVIHFSGLGRKLQEILGLTNQLADVEKKYIKHLKEKEVYLERLTKAQEEYINSQKALAAVEKDPSQWLAVAGMQEKMFAARKKYLALTERGFDKGFLDVELGFDVEAGGGKDGGVFEPVAESAAEAGNSLDAFKEKVTNAWAEVAKLEAPTENLIEKVADYANYMTDLGGRMSDVMLNTFDQLAKGIGNAVASAIVYGENLGESMVAVMKQVAASIISSIIEIGIQYLIGKLIMATAVAAELATRMGAAAAMTYGAAYAAMIGPATAAFWYAGPAVAAAYAAGAVGSMMAGAGTSAAVGAGFGIAGLAEGGIVTKPMIAMIGEAGPEAVVPLSGKAGGLGGEIHVHLELDKRSLTDIVLENLPQRVRYKLGRII